MLSISEGLRRRSSLTLSYSTPSMITSGSELFLENAPRRLMPQLSSPGAEL